MNNWFVFIMTTFDNTRLLAVDNDKTILEDNDIVLNWNLTKENALAKMYKYSSETNVKTVNYNQ